MAKLADRFGKWLGFDAVDLMQDWGEYEDVVAAFYKESQMTPPLRTKPPDGAKATMPQLYKLMCVEGVLPFSTAEVECGFSTANSMKTSRRSGLQVGNVDQCARTSLTQIDLNVGAAVVKSHEKRRGPSSANPL